MHFFLALLLLLPVSGLAQDFKVPAIRNHVVDEASLINSNVENDLNAALALVKRDTGVEMAVLTVESLEGLSIEQATVQVVEKWQLGTSEADRGLLLLVSKNDRKLRFEVGYGLEGDLTDAEAGRIINNSMVPLLKQGDYNQAILTGVVQALQQAVPNTEISNYFNNGKSLARHSRKPKSKKLLSTLFTILVWVIIYFVLGRRGFLGAILGSSLGRGYRGGGGFGSGGGSFGGGGGFGGGGASGGW